MVKLLLETGKVDADSKDSSGQTPLQRAAGEGHEAVVKLLLETGSLVHIPDIFRRDIMILDYTLKTIKILL